MNTLGSEVVLNFRRYAMAAIFPWIAMLSACAPPHIAMGSWKDPAYHKKITKIFVIGVTQREEIRRAFEADVVARLLRKEINAVGSADLVPLDKGIAKERVKAQVKAAIAGKGFDAVLVSRLIGVDKTTTYVPPSATMEYSFTRDVMTAYSVAFTPGQLIQDTVVSIETNLYDTATEHLVWSMRSKSFNPTDAAEVINPLADAIVKDLAKKRLI